MLNRYTVLTIGPVLGVVFALETRTIPHLPAAAMNHDASKSIHTFEFEESYRAHCSPFVRNTRKRPVATSCW